MLILGVYPIDHKLDMDIEGLLAAAQQSANRVFLHTFESTIAKVQHFETRKRKMTVRGILLAVNDPNRLTEEKDRYLQIARVRRGERFVGADLLAGWYQRNFCIFSNLVRIIDSPEDRVLVIFGSGHSPVRRELVQSSPDLQLVEASKLLAGR